MIDTCPWHGCKLTNACTYCSSTIIREGLIRTVAKGSQSDEFEETSKQYVYKSQCEHLYFSPAHLVRLNLLTKNEQHKIQSDCNQLLNWWYAINCSSHQHAPFAKRIFTYLPEDEELEKCLAVATEIAGPSPWPFRLTPSPVGFFTWRQTGEEGAHLSSEQYGEYAKIYKSIRRYVFRRYIRQHRQCWNDIASLKDYEAQYLSASSVCSLALAYTIWRMHMERYRYVESFRSKESSGFRLEIGFRLYQDNVESQRSVLAIASLCLVEFFVTLNRIEKRIDTRSFDIFQWGCTTLSKLRGSSSHFRIESETPGSRHKCGQWLIIYTNPEYLELRAKIRCVGKIKKADIDRKFYTFGKFSLFNYSPKRDILFRVINISEQRSNLKLSHAYQESYYSI